MLQGRGDLGKWKGPFSQRNLLAIAVIAQVKRDDAIVLLAYECGDVGSAAVSMPCVEQERDQGGIRLRVKCVDLTHLGLKLPPVAVISKRQAKTLAECAGSVQP